jgi:hypothetical protein
VGYLFWGYGPGTSLASARDLGIFGGLMGMNRLCAFLRIKVQTQGERLGPSSWIVRIGCACTGLALLAAGPGPVSASWEQFCRQVSSCDCPGLVHSGAVSGLLVILVRRIPISRHPGS